MPRSRLMAPGAGGLNWGVNRLGNQGGGDKKQGLVSTTNARSPLVPHIRTRADGGNSRHWVFCMNQLGGVGRRWGQAAGPGNRGGVRSGCKALAAESRRLYPRRQKQGSGYGHTTVFRSLVRVAAPQDCPFGTDASGKCKNPCMWVSDPTTGNHSCTQEDKVCQYCCGDYIETAENCHECVKQWCGTATCKSWLPPRQCADTDDCTAAIAKLDGYDPAWACNTYVGIGDNRPCAWVTLDPSSNEGYCGCTQESLKEGKCTMTAPLCQSATTSETCNGTPLCAWDSLANDPRIDGSQCKFNCAFAKDKATCEGDAFSSACSWVDTASPVSGSTGSTGHCRCKAEQLAAGTCFTDPAPKLIGDCSNGTDEDTCGDLGADAENEPSCIWFDNKCMTNCAVLGQSNCHSIVDLSGNQLCTWNSIAPGELRGQCFCNGLIPEVPCFDGQFNPRPSMTKTFKCTATDEYSCLANALCEWASGEDGTSYCRCSQKAVGDSGYSTLCARCYDSCSDVPCGMCATGCPLTDTPCNKSDGSQGMKNFCVCNKEGDSCPSNGPHSNSYAKCPP